MNFQFTNRKTNKVEKLNDIDRQMCEDTSVPYDDKHYTIFFQWVTLIGCLPRLYVNGTLNADLLDKHLKEEFDKLEPNEIKLVKKYLIGNYVFDCWFSR